MKSPMTHRFLFALVLAFAFVSAFYILLYLSGIQQAHASAPSGLRAVIATTTRPTVSATANLIIATSTCASRIISTATSSIMIGFSDINGFVPSAMQGVYQAASTTVGYDGGIYGCGAVRVYSFSTQALTVMEGI